MNLEISRIGDRRYLIGEGPLWDWRNRILYWVDAMAGEIHSYDPSSGKFGEWRIEGTMLGSIALREKGGMIVATTDGLYEFDLETGLAKAIFHQGGPKDSTRFNDGKVDRQGRFLAGTTVRPGFHEPLAALYRLSTDMSVEVLEDELHLANGPAFSPDGRTFYFTDSVTSLIWAYDYSAGQEKPARRRVFIDTKPLGSLPDGATVDVDGCLWFALALCGKVARATPDGRIDRLIDMPVPHPTSIMFGGDDLETLFVTSGYRSESRRINATDPLSGSLYRIDGLSARGIPEPYFKG